MVTTTTQQATIPRCDHVPAEPQHWPWLPSGTSGVMAAHPFCRGCGLVRSFGSERPLDLGGIINILSDLGHILEHNNKRLTETQRRLVLKKIRERGIDDPYGGTRAHQYHNLALILSQTLGIKPHVLHNHLLHC